MVATSSNTIASIILIPNPCIDSSSSTSTPVMMTPQKMGIWNNMSSATAPPRTSARSHAMIAISAMSQFGARVHLGYQS